MGSTPSPKLVEQTLLWIMLISITSIMVLTAIAYFSYKYTETFYKNVRLGNVYLFDAMTKYKTTIMYTLMTVLFVVITYFY